MEWIAIIGLILELFGPLIKQLIEKWLNKAAKAMPAAGSGANPAAEVGALFDKAISMAGPLARVLLRIAKGPAVARAKPVFAKAAGENVKIPPLTKAEREEFSSLV